MGGGVFGQDEIDCNYSNITYMALSEQNNFIQECYYCKQKVNFELLIENSGSDRSYFHHLNEVYIAEILAKCTKCKEVSLFFKKVLEVETGHREWNWDIGEYVLEIDHPEIITRLYPINKELNHLEIGFDIYESYEEAKKLYENGFFNPAMTSLRRTLENICLEKGINKKLDLEKKLVKLLELNIIDQKLYDWGEALRKAGNMTTHTNEKIKEEDLQDMFYFTELVIDYIFVLSKKFEDYKQRHLATPRASL